MIRFGLLGCGRIARRHSDLLGGNHIAGARLVAVCESEQARADALAAKFGVPAHCDLDDMLAHKDIDVIVVRTPSGLHPQRVPVRSERRADGPAAGTQEPRTDFGDLRIHRDGAGGLPPLRAASRSPRHRLVIAPPSRSFAYPEG